MINYIQLYPNLQRLYEVARVGQFRVHLFKSNDTKPADHTIVERFFHFDQDGAFETPLGYPNGMLYAEMTPPDFPYPIRSTETLVESNERIRKAKTRIATHDLSTGALTLVKSAFTKLDLTLEQLETIMKTAEAIAQLDNSPKVKIEHYAEAIQYQCKPDPEE